SAGVGGFASDTLLADTTALASGSAADDSAYTAEQVALRVLADDRDRVAADIKDTLNDAAAGTVPNHGRVTSGLAHVTDLLRRADKPAAGQARPTKRRAGGQA